jgi:uncharacterized phage-associated protein
MAYSSLSVANAFIALACNEGKKLSNMQLQKLVFFAHGYLLAYLNRPLTIDEVKAWTFGPVYPLLYNVLRINGSEGTDQIIPGQEIILEDDENQIIQAVWNAYKHHSAYQLSRISHNVGSPWSQTWLNQEFSIIPDNITQAYYQKLIKQ